MRVVIIGGGVGGLTLAHGLRRRGIDVAVYERDSSAGARWEGYRIHVDPHGLRSLAACLPAGHLQILRDTASYTNDFAMTTEHLRVLVSIPGDERWPLVDGEVSHLGVDRAVLRRVLLTGLDGVVTLGAEFVGAEHTPDGRVTARFADGSSTDADVLVGADGAGSRVARELLPGDGPARSGGLAVVQKLPLTAERRSWIPEVLTRGMTVTCPSQPGFMFTAAFGAGPGVADRLTAFGVEDVPEVVPYLLVSLVLDADVAPDGIEAMNTDTLTGVCTEFVDGWHPTVQRLIAECEPRGRRVLVFRAADPLPPVPWTHAPITLLGDAMHQMPPVGGLGGNTALRDAALLSDTLAEVEPADVDDALREYETAMCSYAGTAIRDALKMQKQNLSADGLFTALSRNFFKLAGQVPAVQRIETAARPG